MPTQVIEERIYPGSQYGRGEGKEKPPGAARTLRKSTWTLVDRPPSIKAGSSQTPLLDEVSQPLLWGLHEGQEPLTKEMNYFIHYLP